MKELNIDFFYFKSFKLVFFDNLNFNTTSLGSDISILNQIASGKHYFCYYLLKAKTPLIICSSIIFNNSVAFYKIIELIQSLVLKFNLNIYPFIVTLPQYAYEPNMYELALTTSYYGSSAHTISDKFKAILLFNSDFSSNNIDLNFLGKFKGDKLTVACSAFGSKKLLNYDLLLPIQSNFEIEEHFINLQGFLQKTKAIFLNTGSSITSHNFFSTLLSKLKGVNNLEGKKLLTLDHVLGYNTSNQVSTSIIGNLSWVKLSLNKNKNIFINTQKLFLNSNVFNFYVSSQSLTSRIMFICSKQFISKSTFFGK